MKLTKLMLSACVAALALVSCNKGTHTPEGPQTGLKSIEIKINNSVLTKGDGGGAVPADNHVFLNNLRIYLTDDSYSTFYVAYAQDGSTPATSYWEGTELTTLMAGGEINFHYVDPAVTKVIAVGNMGDTPYASVTALKDAALDIDGQQDHEELSLYGEGPVTGPSGTHTDVNVLNNIYTASVTLKPRISRFEVAGFRVKFNDTPKYNTIEVLQLAFDNYMPTATFYTGAETGTLVDRIADAQLEVANNADVYTWLAGNTGAGWWYDTYAAGAISLTKTAPVKDVDQLAYHFFAGNVKPQFIIHLTADGVPAYVYTKKLKDENDAEIIEFAEGTIYRMSAEGESVDNGVIEIPEDKIDQMDRCLDITVTVAPWVVTLVTPEF